MSSEEYDYLSPSFDLTSLTVPRLRGILVHHDVSYPASAKKSQLVSLVESEVLPQAKKILSAQRRAKRSSRGIVDMPSSQEGTIDGDEDEPRDMPPPPSARRSSRRTTRSVTEDSVDSLSTTAVGSRTPGRRTAGAAKHARDVEPLDEEEEEEVKRPGRKTRKSGIEPTPRAAHPDSERHVKIETDDSPFSNDNPFQSGSSPLAGVRSTSGDHRRRTVGTSKEERTKSTSRRRTAPASRQSDGNRVIKQEDGAVVPSSSTFEVPIKKLRKPQLKLEEPEEAMDAGEEFTPEEQLSLVRERALNGQDMLPPRRRQKPRKAGAVSKYAPWVVILGILGGVGGYWRNEKVEIGYCGVGKSNWSLSDTQAPEWVDTLQPQCEPCPQHAYCFPDMEVQCEPDFVKKPHPLSVGGLVPLPPTCEPDGEKVRKIKVVADRAVEELRERRAQYECGTLTDSNGRPDATVELPAESLKAAVSQKRRRNIGQAEFEDLWAGALGDLLGRDEVTSSADG